MAADPVVLLNKSAVIVNSGSTYTLTALALPDTAVSKRVLSYQWAATGLGLISPSTSTTSSSVITVNPAAISNSTVNISVTANLEGGTTEDSSYVTRVMAINPVVSIEITDATTGDNVTGTTISGVIGSTSQNFIVRGIPVGGNGTIYWSSSNSSCASVSSVLNNSAEVTYLTNGTVTITATSQDGAKTASFIVTVGSGVFYKPVQSVTIPVLAGGLPNTTVGVGNQITLTATVLPAEADQTVFWSYPSSAIVTVDALGVVTGNAVGTAIVTATTRDGAKKATVTITVVNSQTGLYLDTVSLSVVRGATQKITAYPFPFDATTPAAVAWSSSDTTLATVDNTGLVKGVKIGGPVTITATYRLPDETVDRTDTAVVNVLDPNLKIIEMDLYGVSPQGYSTMVGKTKTVRLMRDAVFNIPVRFNANDPSEYLPVQWTATPNNVLVLEPKDGVVPSCNVTILNTVNATTTVTLTATAASGGYSDTMRLVVPAVVPTLSVSIDTDKITPANAFVRPNIRATATGGIVYNVPAIVGGAVGITNTSLVWSVSEPDTLVLTPINCPLNPGCAFTVVPNSGVSYCVLLAKSLYDSGLSAYVGVSISQI